MPLRRHPRLVLAVWVVYWCLLFIATHVPMPEGPHLIRHADKIEHVVAYFILALLGGWSISVRKELAGGAPGATAPRRALWCWALVYVLYGIVDELLQSLVGRSMTLGDWLADVFGVTSATLLLVRLGGRNYRN